MGIIAQRLKELGEPRPRNVGFPLQVMKETDGIKGCFHATERMGGIFIHTLQSIDYGGGRAALVAICRLADELGCPVYLEPKPYRTLLHRTPRTPQELIAYYSSYGFVGDEVSMKRLPLTAPQERNL